MPARNTVDAFFRKFRTQLAGVDALPQLALLGLLVGAVTGAIIIVFRFLIEWPLAWFLPGGDPENFEGLSFIARSVLPLAGAVVIGAIWYRIGISQRKVGVAFVIERLNFHQGYISVKSFFTQFFGGILTILSGQSAGREGPAVHLGAACASLLGQYMRLPNNSIRTLISCGVAAAISASFNTPIAGVIFAMEVVMMEYSIKGFTPVIIASVTAALVSQAVYGVDPAFLVPKLTMNSLLEVPYIIICGLIIGCASALFVQLIQRSISYQHHTIFVRIIGAGAITALAAMAFPQIMGIGYDTVNAALWGEMGIILLFAIALTKLVVTAVTTGLGMPNGLVGPTLFIGASLGGAFGLIANLVMPETSSSPGFYAMLGMGAMMGSALQAPLAALMALLELTHNPNIILPGMLIIVVSSMIASEVFKQKSVFLSILESQGLNYQNNPITQALRRVSVGAIMERDIARAEGSLTYQEVKALLNKEPKWILVNDSASKPKSLLPTVDLARYMEENEKEILEAENDALKESILIHLMEIPAQRRDVASLYFQATLQEALDRFNETNTEALYVERTPVPLITRVIGVVTRSEIENYYRYKQN